MSQAADLDVQVDFSGGQINQSARRRLDVDTVKSGGKTSLNWQVTATGQLIQRPGRSLVAYTDCPRGDFIRVSTGEEFSLRFAANQVTITDLLGKVVVTQNDPTKIIWEQNNLDRIVWTQAQDAIYMCYPRMRPYIATWDRSERKWSFFQFAFDQGAGTIKMPFYRRAVLGAVISYDATKGDVTLTCSKPYFTANMVGATLSIVGQQVILKEFISTTKMKATINYRLPESIAVVVDNIDPFLPGMIVQFAQSGVKFEVGSVKAEATQDKPNGGTIIGILLNNIVFEPAAFEGNKEDSIVSPLGSSFSDTLPGKADPGSPTVQWQEEFFSSNQGYPESCSYDRGRLIFTAFPQATNAILWSQLGSPNSFWIDSIASTTQPGAGGDAKSAIFELISGSPDVFFVEGWQQGIFTFTRRGIYYSPINQQYPVQPGNITFDKISDDGVANVRPVTIQDAILFINSGLNRIGAVRPTGSATRPFLAYDFTDTHTDLFKSPRQLTVRTSDGARPERVIYVVNADGTLVVGKAIFSQQTLFVGWMPWTTEGIVKWVSAKGPNVFYTTQNLGKTGPYYALEAETEAIYLDHSLLVNSDNGQANPPAGFGLFYKKKAGSLVTLMDGNIDYGERPIDDKGNIIFSPSESLTSGTLIAGTFTKAVFEPFSYFQKQGDRTKRIGISRALINVEGATDFMLGNKVFACQRFGDDGSEQPVLLDGSFRIRVNGRGWEQTVPVTKHRPGPITVCELTLEVSN